MTNEEKAFHEFFKSKAYKRFLEDRRLGQFDPRKERTMTDMNQVTDLNQVPQNAEVTIEDMPEFLKRLQEDGEVTVQTAADTDGQPVRNAQEVPAPQAA